MIPSIALASLVVFETACERPDGWRISTASEDRGGCQYLTCTLASPTNAVPPRFDVFFRCEPRGAHNAWVPIEENGERNRLWATEWGAVRYTSELAKCEPICTAYREDGTNSLTICCSEALRHVRYGITVVSTDARLEGRFRFFDRPEAPRRDYSVTIRVDRRPVFWGAAVREGSAWIAEAAGLRPCHVPESAYDPLYSSWYAFWQDVHDDEIVFEAKAAAELGMKTAILDDGWQKEQSKTFYSATGDWMPVKGRFPDFRAHVDKVHRSGVKYMLWLSVPFVGNESKVFGRFRGKFLNAREGDTNVLDPRFPEVREYLISTYERCVRDWDFDGLKLDFIDAIACWDGVDPAVAQDYAGRDCKTVPEGIDRLMREVHDRLAKLKPDVLIEFRQRYTGPAIRRYGNMLRATDCPYDLSGNRRRIADLRLTSGGTAVHSDMLVWSPSDGVEDAGRVILNAIFATVQYSMKLATVSDAHRELIRHWIGFSADHRDTLLKSDFRPHHPELMYPWIEAEGVAERIVAVYAVGQSVPVGSPKKPTWVLNATPAGSVTVDASAPFGAEAFDALGRKVGVRRYGTGPQAVACPASGYVALAF